MLAKHSQAGVVFYTKIIIFELWHSSCCLSKFSYLSRGGFAVKTSKYRKPSWDHRIIKGGSGERPAFMPEFSPASVWHLNFHKGNSKSQGRLWSASHRNPLLQGAPLQGMANCGLGQAQTAFRHLCSPHPPPWQWLGFFFFFFKCLLFSVFFLLFYWFWRHGPFDGRTNTKKYLRSKMLWLNKMPGPSDCKKHKKLHWWPRFDSQRELRWYAGPWKLVGKESPQAGMHTYPQVSFSVNTSSMLSFHQCLYTKLSVFTYGII